MSLPDQTVRKLMRENFTGQSPLVVPLAEKETLAATIKQHLTGLSQVSINTSHYFSSEQEKARSVCSFSVEDRSKSMYYGSSTAFRLMINAKGQLTIDHYREQVVISNLDELWAFIAACQERLERRATLEKKREKVRDLKAQAIVARVKKLAKEEKFDFATDTDSLKLKLFVKLSEKDCIELYVPFKDFETALPHLRATILSLRELYNQGIRFKLRPADAIGWRKQWVSHETL